MYHFLQLLSLDFAFCISFFCCFHFVSVPSIIFAFAADEADAANFAELTVIGIVLFRPLYYPLFWDGKGRLPCLTPPFLSTIFTIVFISFGLFPPLRVGLNVIFVIVVSPSVPVFPVTSTENLLLGLVLSFFSFLFFYLFLIYSLRFFLFLFFFVFIFGFIVSFSFFSFICSSFSFPSFRF